MVKGVAGLFHVLGLGLVLALTPNETYGASGEQACCRRQEGRGGQHGMGTGMGMGMGDETHADDMAVFRFLLDNRDAIRRDVTQFDNGIESLTESDDHEVAAKIREHVTAMYQRMRETRPIHARDPLFAEVFRHADAIEIAMVATEKGIRVKETSTDPYVVQLIQAHAEVVNGFIENGHIEMRKNHAVPERPERPESKDERNR
ncbi:MAG TPA: hypothetical protein VEK15_28655 [Vicinamibacteria bacterium]|nr:hypothetical protein [Vicinamibacteria bacterium]